MRKIWNERLRVAIGAVLLAAGLFVLVAMPGLVSDQDSMVPLHQAREAQEARR